MKNYTLRLEELKSDLQSLQEQRVKAENDIFWLEDLGIDSKLAIGILNALESQIDDLKGQIMDLEQFLTDHRHWEWSTTTDSPMMKPEEPNL